METIKGRYNNAITNRLIGDIKYKHGYWNMLKNGANSMDCIYEDLEDFLFFMGVYSCDSHSAICDNISNKLMELSPEKVNEGL